MRETRAASIRGVHHVNIRVPPEEIEALRDFYCDVVGLARGPRPPFGSHGFWLYAGGRAVVHLSQCRPGESLPPPGARASAFSHVALDCTGFAATAARLRAAGVSFREAEVPLTGERQLFFRDPAGVGVELIFPLAE